MRKVLHIVPTPFFASRGCHMRILGEIKALERKGYKNVVVTYHHGEDVDGVDIYRTINIPWYKKLEAGPCIHKYYTDILLFFKALRIFLKEKPDVIHGHLHEGAFIGHLVRTFAFSRKTPLTFDVQGSLTKELETFSYFKKMPFLKKPFEWLERFICNNTDYFICSSNSNAELIEGMGYSKEIVEPVIDGVHAGFFDIEPDLSFKEELGIPKDKKVVVYTGALLRAKGLNYLLEIIPPVLKACEDTYFLVVGYPVEEAKEEVEKMGLSDRVIFCGMVDYFQLPKYLSVADVAVDPKEDKAGEASGKIINYMGAGLPVVCFESLNNHNFLDKSGIFAKNTDGADLAAKVISTVKDSEFAKKMGDMAKDRVEKVYSWDASIKKITDAFDYLLDKRK